MLWVIAYLIIAVFVSAFLGHEHIIDNYFFAVVFGFLWPLVVIQGLFMWIVSRR